ncbi:hypothetical protein HDE_13878 [Halotydeus destructor]|nr:hypothetical protein HDE_13878 [Halotydeus destructor]
MHSAVWSQPTTSGSKFRTHPSTNESPETFAGKCVLGVGITLVLVGGLLCVLGLTGFFVRDDNKRYLGMASLAGLVSIATGISGCRAVSNWDRAKKCTDVYTVMTLVNTVSCTLITLMAIFIILQRPQLLLTTVIAVSELTLGCLGSLLSLSGFVTALAARPILRYPLGAESSRSTNRKSRGDE